MLYPNDSQCVDKLKEECGVLKFYKGNILLFISETGNLRKKFISLHKLKEIDENVGVLFKEADSMEALPTASLIDALIAKKSCLESTNPEYNSKIQLWQKYVYLAINPAEFPFCKITEFTDEDWFYIGPFKSRFFLVDFMELMMKLLKLPNCEVKTGPCEKLENNQCRGWCVLIKQLELAKEIDSVEQSNGEEADDSTESQNPNLIKLDALLKEAYVHADNGLVEMVQNEKNKYEEDLQFARADLLTESIDLLKRYKQWLSFLYATKTLAYDTDKVNVKEGQIIKYRFQDKEIDCPIIKTEFRGNEKLAINKNMVDEAWILYQERT